MAVGVALEKAQLEPFRARFAAAVREFVGGNIGEQELEIAAWLGLGQIGEELVAELDALHPFGQGNPDPVFGIRGVCLAQGPEIFKEQHFRFSVDGGDGRRLHGVAWKMAERLPPRHTPLDVAVQLHWNHFNGRKLLQMELVDWRLAEPQPSAGGVVV